MLIKNNVGLTALVFITAFTAHADFKNIRISNFQGQYLSPQGSGKAEEFTIPTVSNANNPLYSEIKIFKGNENFQLSIDQHDFLWEDVPSSLLEMQTLNWSNIDFNTAPKRISLSIQSLQGVSESKKISLSRATASCSHKGETHEDFVDNLLESCLNGSARLRIASFNNEDKSDFLNKSKLTQFIHVLQGINDKAPSVQQELEDVEVNISNHSFEARLKTKVVINATIKAEGRTYFDSEKQIARIRIDKVKASFFNITDKVFEELEKKQGPGLKVDRPWVYVYLEK